MVIDNLGHSEIRYFDSIFMNKNIFWFDVSMDNVTSFQKLESYHHLSYKSSNHLLTQALRMFEYKVFQSTFITVLNKQKQGVRTFLCIDVLQNIRMGYFSEKVDLL